MAVTQILSTYCQRANVNNATTKNTLKRVTEAAGIEVFCRPKNESAFAGTSRLVEDRS